MGDAKLEGPVPGEPFLVGGGLDFAAAGYVREEWIVSGTAPRYALTGPQTEDGRWDAARSDGAAFRTRIVVVRPGEPARFDGTVFVEWFNVSGGLDAAPDFLFLHRHLLREGAAWVGVSAQKAGIDGGGLVPGMPLKQADAARYGALDHPGDAYAFGIFDAVGRLVRDGGALGPLAPRCVIAVGESQSAAYLVTHVNAVDPLERVYDAYLVHGRPGAAAALDGASFRPAADGDVQDVGAILSAAAHRVRDDARAPVLTLQSETDVVLLGGGRARQPDSERFRLWELAGAAHFDTYGLLATHADRAGVDVQELARELAPRRELLGMAAECCVNAGPQQHYVAQAAAHHLVHWVRDGTPPPEAPRLETADPAGTALVRDALGIARGGIRTPWVEAPSAVLSGEPPGGEGFLFLFGTTRPLDPGTLARLYPGGADEHRRRFAAATDAAVAAGFLLADDADEIRALARHGRQPSGWAAA